MEPKEKYVLKSADTIWEPDDFVRSMKKGSIIFEDRTVGSAQSG